MLKFKTVLRDGRIIEAEAKNKFRFSEFLYKQGFNNMIMRIEDVEEIEVKNEHFKEKL